MKQTKPYITVVKIGTKGQIVIPKQARDMFELKPGDSLVLFAHREKGMALASTETLTAITKTIFPIKDSVEKKEML